MPAAEGNDSVGGLARHAVPYDFRSHYTRHRHPVVQAHLVNPIAQSPNHSILQGTFDFPAASVMLDSDDPTGRERVPSRKRAAEKSPDHFGYRSCPATGIRWLDEPLLAGKTRLR